MANKLIFKDAEAAKDAIMASQKKEIADLYESWADEIGERAKYYSHKSTASAPVSERYYRELQKQLRQTSQEVSNEIYKKIKSNIYTVADAVVSDNVKWLESFGFSSDGLNAAFSYVPHEIVQNLVTGQIYDSGWSLSSRIWGDNEQTLKDIYQVMAKGLAENKPIYEIAKDLESYVRPSARLPWNLRMADGKKIYKKQVDYNAQRLARTLVQHGYQQSFIATTQKNPFITEYVWRSNGSRVCDLCKARDGVHYKKTELPMDHPNGMCTMEPVVADDMIDQLVDWFNSPDGTYPEIDAFAGNFGYQASKTGTVQDFIAKYGMSSKSPSSWFNSLTQIQKAEAKALKEASGLKWNDWYEQNIYEGGVSIPAKAVKKTKVAEETVVKETVKEVVKIEQKSTFNADEWRSMLRRNDTDEMENWCKEWLKTIKGNEKSGVKQYSGNAYIDMNNSLRGIGGDYMEFTREEINKYIDGCTKALEKASLPEDIIVRRASGYNMLEELNINITESNKNKLIGGIVEDKGFTSTSPDPSGGFDNYEKIEYIIKVPKGSQAMYIEPISMYKGEKELLINRGSKYIVEDIEFNNDENNEFKVGNVAKIYMTLINLNH